MTHTQANASTAKPPKKKISPFRVGLIILGLLLFLLLLRLVLILTGIPTISVDYVDQYNQITKPVDYGPNQNAARYYKKAFDYLVDMPAVIGRSCELWPADMNDSELKIVEDWLALNAQALSHLEKATSRPYYWVRRYSHFAGSSAPMYDLDFSDLTKLVTARYCFDFQAKMAAERGQARRAIQLAICTYRMGGHFCGPKSLREQMIGIHLKKKALSTIFAMLDRQGVNAEKLGLFQQQINNEISRSNQVLDFECERLILYDVIQTIFTHNGHGNGSLIPRQAYTVIEPLIINGPEDEELMRNERDRYLSLIWDALTGPDRRQTVRIVDRYFDYLDSVKRQTPWQLRSKNIDLEKKTERIVKRYYIKEAIGNLYRVPEVFHRQRAREAALNATIAILCYKAEKGQLPEGLEHLVSTGYLDELPMDPYSEGPLAYKRVGDNFILYSVGVDFDNDGGVRSDWGEGDSGDQVFWPLERPKKNQTKLTRRVRRVK